jgi:hypothetical protein
MGAVEILRHAVVQYQQGYRLFLMDSGYVVEGVLMGVLEWKRRVVCAWQLEVVAIEFHELRPSRHLSEGR